MLTAKPPVEDPARRLRFNEASARQTSIPRVLKQFLFQSVLWTFLCLGIELLCRFLFHWGYPYNYPAVPPSAIFGDFRYWVAMFAGFHTKAFFNSGKLLMYPASVAVVYKLFLIPQPLAKHHGALFATLRFISAILLSSWIMLAGFRRSLIRRGLESRPATFFVLAVYLLSFPFWFEVHQGNMECAVWVLMIVGIWAFWTSRSWVAMACFGLAGALKIFPLVFLGLFLIHKQYRQLVGALLVAGAAAVVSLWLVCPDIAYSYQQTSAALEFFRRMYMLHLRPIESGFDHSLFALIKYLMPSLPPEARMGRILDIYLATAAIGGCALFFVRIRKLPLINQILCLTIAAILLPPTSYDYTLLHLYAPFALLSFVALEHAQDETLKFPRLPLYLAFSLFAFLLSAQSEFIFHGIRFAGQLKAIALLLLWLVALKYPFPSTEAADAQ